MSESDKEWYDNDYWLYHGLALGFGLNWRINKLFSLDTDLLYPIFDDDILDEPGYEEYGPPIKISIGTGFHW